MAVNIHELILQAKQLPRRQRIVLMAALSDSLLTDEEQPVLSDGDFWASKSLDDFSDEQGTKPLGDWRQFVANDVWPDDEPLEEFESFQEQERMRDIEQRSLADEAI